MLTFDFFSNRFSETLIAKYLSAVVTGIALYSLSTESYNCIKAVTGLADSLYFANANLTDTVIF